MKIQIYDAVGRVRGETDAWRVTPWWMLPTEAAQRFQQVADRHRTEVLALAIYIGIMVMPGESEIESRPIPTDTDGRLP